MTPLQTFYDHVNELRGRLFWVAIAICVGAVVGYVLRMPIINFLQHPLDAPLFYSSPAGSFNFIMEICFALGVFVSLPMLIFHGVRFVEPALPIPVRKRLLVMIILSSLCLAAMGAAFAYYIIMPTSLHFFAGYSTGVVKPLISATEYLSYVIGVLVTFMVMFQIPLLVLFINRIKPIKPSQLLRYQRHIIVGAFVLSVILPFTYDPITQFVVAIPVVFLFYLSIILVWWSNRKLSFTPESDQPIEVMAGAVLTEEPQVETETELLLAPKRPVWRKPPATGAPWQDQNGGLISAKILKTAVDVLKPGTISTRPLKLAAPEHIPAPSFNVIDLSQQP